MLRACCLAVLVPLFAACQGAPPQAAEAAPAPRIQVVRLEHTPAVEIAALVNEFAAHRGTRPAAPRPGEVVPPPPMAVAHTATNSVLLSGSAEEVGQMLVLIARLDVDRAK